MAAKYWGIRAVANHFVEVIFQALHLANTGLQILILCKLKISAVGSRLTRTRFPVRGQSLISLPLPPSLCFA